MLDTAVFPHNSSIFPILETHFEFYPARLLLIASDYFLKQWLFFYGMEDFANIIAARKKDISFGVKFCLLGETENFGEELFVEVLC